MNGLFQEGRALTRLLCVILLILGFGSAALAQESEAEDRSYFVGLLENKLSTPDRQIRITGIQGALSSNATIGSITVADREGVWLRITNARIVWTRSALLLGRLNIDTLAADSIEVSRRPLPAEGIQPESTGFALPDLPVSITLNQLQVPRVSFGQGVFGLESVLSLTGRINLADGALDSALDITRVDGPGGQLRLAATYSNSTGVLGLDLALNEPANGVLANLLGIEGRPPVALALQGNGPVSALDLTLALDTNNSRAVSGTVQIRQNAEGYGFSADVGGDVARLTPPLYRDFFGPQTKLTAKGAVRNGGGFALESLALDGAALDVNARLVTAADGFVEQLGLFAKLGTDNGQPVILPVPGGATTLRNATVKLSFGETGEENWKGDIDVDALSTGTFSAAKVAIDLGGLAQNLNQPGARRVSFSAKGAATGVEALRADIAKALGDRLDLDIEGDWNAGQPINLSKALLTGNGLSASLAGRIAEFIFNGDIAVDASSIAPFSALAGRDLAGRLRLDAKGSVAPIGGGFDLTLDGSATGLNLGSAALDRLLEGETVISGRVARGEEGLRAERLQLANPQATINADGVFATGAADFNFDLTLGDLALLSEQASGRLTATGRAKGQDGVIGVTMTAKVPQGELADKPLANATVSFDGMLKGNDIDGRIKGEAALDRVPVTLAADLTVQPNERALRNLQFDAGGTKVSGEVAQGAGGLLTGALNLVSPDISTAAALALVDATGAATANVTLAPEADKQGAALKASVSKLVFGGTRVGRADLDATIADLFGVPVVNGTASAADVLAGGVDIRSLSARADATGARTAFSADAALRNGATVATAGALQPEGSGYRLTLDRADLKQGKLSARLIEPASLLVEGSNIDITGVALDVGGGEVRVSGTAREQLDLRATIRDLPLAIANAVRPDLGLSGTVNGNATVTGTRSAPQAKFDLSAPDIGAAALRQAGIPTLSLQARGQTNAQRLEVDAAVTSPNGLRANLRGGVPLDGGQLALDVALEAFPLSILNAVVPNQNLAGTISGTARATGTLAAPQATFSLRGTGLSAAALANAGAAPLSLDASGRFADNAVTLDALTANGPSGLNVSARGKLPLQGTGADLSVNGEVPLSLANRFLAERGAQATGTLSVSATVRGSLAQPDVRGMFSTQGATVSDPQSNVSLTGISVMGTLDGNQVTIRSASASVGGGTLSLNGTIGTDAGAGFPANLRASLNSVRYADGNLVVATVSGALSLAGPLTRDPLLSGSIEVERAEITVPGSFGGSAAAIDVEHIKPSKAVRETLARARADDGTPTPTARPSTIRLDVRVNAPARIFVRGRGLDAELGGEVRLTGPLTDIQPVGGFRLIRGRLGILGQRITFDEGTVTLVGDLDPFIDFVARSQGEGITVFVNVRGRVSDLDISFSSEPALPQDEVLARLIFKRSIDELSPFQIAQLAAAAAELAGGGNSSLLGSLRNATGLDDLDVVTDSQGNAAVRAGRYIQDNIYLGIEAGGAGGARGTINLDVTDNLKVRGAVGTDSSLGVFYERDY